ncbi:MAG: sigma-70 family RNA polymerase sigma factor, partial [Firmicutes bacterium]|nr:sigma-70 family RNA polymerase sigma factor [Bacillota bacterium]
MHETINFFIQKQKIQNGLISTEKANEYLNRYKELNELEQEQLILFHSRMAFKISKQYIAKNRYEDPSEIYETALHGLVKALNTFDPNKGFKFMTYAYRVVENELLMWTRKKSRRTNEISLEAVLTTDKNNNDLTLEEILAFEDENVTEKLYLSQISDELLCCIKQLSQKQQTIIMKSFELDGEEVETQQSLAQQLSISQSYASSLRDQGISRLKELYTSEWKDILVEREFHNQKLKAIYLAHRDKFSLKDQSMLELFYGIHGNNKYSISELEKLFSTIWDKITEYLMNLIIQLKELSYPYLGYQLSTKQNSILRKQMKKLFLEKESEFTEKEKYVLKHGYQIVGYQKLSIQKMMTELRITRKELEKIHASALKKLAPSPSDLFNKIFAVSYQGGGDLETASSIFLAYKKYESYLTNQEKEFFHTMFQGKYSDITIFLKHMAEVWNISKREIDLFYKKSIKKLNRLNRKKEEHIPTEEELQIIELFSRFHTYLKPSYCDLLEHLYGINGVEHMSIKEYAQILNCSEPNVYNKHHKAINILKNCEQGIFPKSHIPKEPKKLKIEKFQKKKKEIERLYESFKVYLK